MPPWPIFSKTLQMKRFSGLRKCPCYQDARMSFGILKAKPGGTTFARCSTKHERTPTWIGSSSRISVATTESFSQRMGQRCMSSKLCLGIPQSQLPRNTTHTSPHTMLLEELSRFSKGGKREDTWRDSNLPKNLYYV